MADRLFVVFAAQLLCAWISAVPAQAQWSYHGLAGTVMWEMQLHDGFLYAATESGLYTKSAATADTTWSSLGLDGRNVRTFEKLSDVIFIVSVDVTDDDVINSQEIYRTIDGGGTWHRTAEHLQQDAPEGYFEVIRKMPGHPQKLLAGGYTTLAASEDGGQTWQPVSGAWDGFGFATHFIAFDPVRPEIVWAGGESPIMQPFLLKSDTGGEDWQVINLDLGGDNAVYSMAIDPSDPDNLYVGVEGSVLKSTDGGQTWTKRLTPEMYEYFLGLRLSPVRTSRVYASGVVRVADGDLALYISDDGGSTWTVVRHVPVEPFSGVVSLEVAHVETQDTVYLGTWYNGVYSYAVPTSTGVPGDGPHEQAGHAQLQNFPNPFVGATRIRFVTATPEYVRLRVFDVLGREVDRVFDGPLPAGEHRMEWSAEGVPPGMYVCRLEAGSSSASHRIVVLR